METLAHTRKVATWLELAVAPEWRRNEFKVRLHAVGLEKNGGCYAISLDDRWLCVGNGGVTLFHGLSAALHFLKLLGIEHFEPGEAADHSLASHATRYCLASDTQNALLPCDSLQRCRVTH